jgi:hypothetical protein
MVLTEAQRKYQREYMREWRRDPDNRRRGVESAIAWQRRNPMQASWTNYVGSARRRGIEFALTRERFEQLIACDCEYCGAAPAPLNGIDRVDNGFGYIEGNVVTACRACNVAKQTMSVDQFIAWAKRVIAHCERD